jgi:hypothetical protein
MREQEFKLSWEEMVIAHEEAWLQRQMMNVMLMAMLNKNGGGATSTHHLFLVFDKE